MQTGHAIVGTIVLGLTASFGCTDARVPADDNAGSSASATDNGLFDIDKPHRNAAVHITQNADLSGVNCTGTLISPYRVITANHCVTGGGVSPFASGDSGWVSASA